jgi:hypothetical protein
MNAAVPSTAADALFQLGDNSLAPINSSVICRGGMKSTGGLWAPRIQEAPSSVGWPS